MTALLTQCPHCQTSFRVSTAQLNAAHGLVRCGSCLGVFSASANEIRVRAPDGYVVEELPQDDEHEETDRSFSDDSRDEAPSLADDDDAGTLIPVTTAADRLDPQAAAGTSPEPQPQPAVTLPEPSPSRVEYAAEAVTPTKADSSPARPAVQPLPEEHALWRDENETVISLGDMQLDELLDEYPEDASDTPPPAQGPTTTRENDDHSGYASEDEDDDDDDADDRSDRPIAAIADEIADDELQLQAPVTRQTVAIATTVTEPDAKRHLRANLSALADDELDPLGHDQLEALEDLPVTITRNDSFGSRLSQAGLLLLNIVLLLALPLPWLYTERDSLATHPRYAFLAPAVCALFTCTPPPATFANAIYSQQLLVRSHPRYANALEVSFIFHNDTTLPQPFPRVELAFSSFTSQLLANRLFTPQEYLPAELRQLDAMPAKSSVQVVLELEDPGKEAVNYTVKLHPPAP